MFSAAHGRVRIVGGSLIAPAMVRDQSMMRIDFAPQELLGPDRGRRLDPLSQLAIVAIEHARRNAGLVLGRPAESRVNEGVVVGSALGAVATTVRYAKRLVSAGAAATNPIDFPDSIDGAPAAHVALELGLGGPSFTFSDGESSATSAIIHAARMIAWGRATRMHVIVGDCCDDWFATAVARKSCSVDGTVDSPSTLGECVLALVLEAEGLTDRSADGQADPLYFEGFLPARGSGEVASRALPGTLPVDAERCVPLLDWFVDARGTLSLAREPADQVKRLVDPSGVFALAGAWLGALGPCELIAGAPKIVVPEPIAARVHCGHMSLPKLCFVRHRGQ